MRVLIIGGTGNISTSITKYFVERGNDELILFNRGSSEVKGAKTIKVDRTDYADFEEKTSAIGKLDVVIDMICYEPEEAESDVRAFSGRTNQFIFCSTVDVYTKLAKHYPITQDSERRPSPEFPYAYKKAICENTLIEAASNGAFNLTIIRPAATYSDASYPIPLIGGGDQLLKRIKEGRPVIVLGDGLSFWVYAHSDDVGMAFFNASGNEKAFGKAYNVTGKEIMTWESQFNTIAKVMNAPEIDFVHIPTDLLVKMAPKSAKLCGVNFKYHNIFDNSAAEMDLGYRYTISWEEGVKRMIDFHNNNGDIDNASENIFYDMIVDNYRKTNKELVNKLASYDNDIFYWIKQPK